MHKSFDFIRDNRIKKDEKLDKKNIIFLDIDGVLQPYNNQYRFEHDMKETINHLCEKYNDEIYKQMDIYDVCAALYDWDDVAIGILTKMLRVTNSYIVIHSGWKEYNNLEQMKALFRLYNLEDYVIDVCDKGDKVKVVNKYLEEHNDEIEEYIVIDDENMTTSFGYHFIKTSNCLTSKNYEHCVRVLKYSYDFRLEENEFIVYRKNDKIVNVSFRNSIVENKNVIYIQFYKYLSYVNDMDYFIIGNYLIKYFNDLNKDNMGIAILGYVKDEMFDYIRTMYSNKQQYSEYDCMFYYALNNKNFSSMNFYRENYGLVVDKIKEIKW